MEVLFGVELLNSPIHGVSKSNNPPPHERNTARTRGTVGRHPDAIALADGGTHVDAILRRLQIFITEVASVRFRALPVRLGVGRHTGSQFGHLGNEQDERLGLAVAQLIEFYVPDNFRRTFQVPSDPRGKVIEFPKRNVDATKGNGCAHLAERLQRVLSAVVDVPGL